MTLIDELAPVGHRGPRIGGLVCADGGVAVVPQGGNTGLARGATPHASGDNFVLSLERLLRVHEVDPGWHV